VSASQLLAANQSLLRSHASTAEYAAFVHGRNRPTTAELWVQRRQQFVRVYPDLETWFGAPLPVRVGRLYGDGRPSFGLSYRARPYLMFLGLSAFAWFDWDWLLAVPGLWLWEFLAGSPQAADLNDLIAQALQLGYSHEAARRGLCWVFMRLLFHTPGLDVARLDAAAIDELDAAICGFAEHPDVACFYGTRERYVRRAQQYRTYLQYLRCVLYHRGQIPVVPRKRQSVPPQLPVPQARMEAVIQRYLATRRLASRPSTIQSFSLSLRSFVIWLARAHAEVASFAEVDRPHVLAYAAALGQHISADTGRALSARTKEGYLSTLATFFRDVVAWQWEDVPNRPLLNARDVPRRARRVPRYIPEAELTRLMDAVRSLECPYQRAALLIARWSGARRDEIRRLDVDCLDAYPDGTPRLRIPAGKTYQERLVPLHEEAAVAIRVLQLHRASEPTRGLVDELTGRLSRRLFIHHGKLFSTRYLFESPLWEVCRQTGLVTPNGKPTMTAHRFRHTVGMQLAERGAQLNTIMKVLGHVSAGMAVVYAQVTDQTVLRDYQAVLGAGATIAGPCATAIRAGDLSAETVDWLKANFFKTELELGHCLRLPQEGPCECDLYLSCAKFVTTKEYAPRLRSRRQRELGLTEDAASRGWEREVERHRCTAQRIEQLLAELGEPLD